MNRHTFKIQFITDALLGGATPHEAAEVRVPSIRGQLRWWTRALGLGRAEENRLFGSIAGDSGRASSVTLRVSSLALPPASQVVSPLHQFATVEASTLGVQDINSGAGYLTFPLRPQRNGQPHRRGRIPPKTTFNLECFHDPSLPRLQTSLAADAYHVLGPLLRSLCFFAAKSRQLLSNS